MPSSQISDAELHAFVDDALDEPDRARVEAWMSENPDDAARVAAYAAQNASLRASFDPVLREPVPDRLTAVIGATRAPARAFAWQRIAAAIGFIVAGGLAGWTVRDQWPVAADAEITGFALNAHTVYVAEKRHAVEVQAAEEQHLVGWLSNRLGKPIKTPDLIGLGYRLVGGRLLPDGGLPTAQFMYENGAGNRLTVYVQRNDRVKETKFHFTHHDGVSAFYWVDEYFAYVLVGAVEREGLLEAAKIVHDSLAR
jgi:anti-sigma factor RsiW